MSEHKPCPFCGGTWILPGNKWSAICNDCGATGPMSNKKGEPSDAKKLDMWNSRVVKDKP